MMKRTHRGKHCAVTWWALLATVGAAWGQSERKTTPGPGPEGDEQVAFSCTGSSTDHAEGITTLDMNGDGVRTW